MNPDAPRTAQEELEIRITALLMGELPPDEAAELLRQIADDPELTALYSRMRHAVELLREARSLPEQPAPEIPLQLSKERREKLLAKFHGLKPMPPLKSVPTPRVLPSPRTILAPQQKKKRDWKWIVPMGIAASITIVAAGFLLPASPQRRFVVGKIQQGIDLEGGMRYDTPHATTVQESGVINDGTSRFRLADNGREQSAPAGGPGKDALAKGWASQPGAIRSLDASSSAKAYILFSDSADGQKLAEATKTARPASALYLPKASADGAKDGETRGENLSLAKNETLYRNAPRVDGGIGSPMPATSAPQRPTIALGRQFETESEVTAATNPTPSEPASGGNHWQFNQSAGGRATADAKPFATGTFAVNGHGANSDFALAPSNPVPLASAEVDVMARERLEDPPEPAPVVTKLIAPSSLATAAPEIPKLPLAAFEAQRAPAEEYALSEMLTVAGKVNPNRPIAAFKAKPAAPVAVAAPAKPEQASNAFAFAGAPASPTPPPPSAAPAPEVVSLASSLKSDVSKAKDGPERSLVAGTTRYSGATALNGGKLDAPTDAAPANDWRESDKKEALKQVASNATDREQVRVVAARNSVAEERKASGDESPAKLGFEVADKEAQKILDLDKYNKAAETRRNSVVEAKNEFGEAAYNSTRQQAMSGVSKEWQRPYRRFEKKTVDITDKGEAAKPAAATATVDSQSQDTGGQQQFVESFLTARKGEDAEKRGRTKEAVENYREAANNLAKVKREFPNWQSDIVDFRLKHTMESLNRLEGGKVGSVGEALPPMDGDFSMPAPERKRSEQAAPVSGPEPAPLRVVIDPQGSDIRSDLAGLATGSGVVALADNSTPLQKKMEAHDYDNDGLALGVTPQAGNGIARGGQGIDVAGRGLAEANAPGALAKDGRANTWGDDAKIDTASGPRFWDMQPTEGAKPAQDAKQWFGRTAGGVGGVGGGTATYFSAGGTRGTAPLTNFTDLYGQTDGTAVAGDNFVDVSGGAAVANGGNAITGGNRSGSLAISANAIDALLFEKQDFGGIAGERFTKSGKGEVTGTSTSDGGTVIANGREANAINDQRYYFRGGSGYEDANSDSGAVDGKPAAETRFGTTVTEVGRKLVDAAKGKDAGALNFTGGTVVAKPAPVVGADGYSIDMNLQPQEVEFEGFINYGSPIQTTSVDAQGRQVVNVIGPSVINQPIFTTRKVTTNVTLPVTGPLFNNTEDKLAQLGDLDFSLPAPGIPTGATEDRKTVDTLATTTFARRLHLDVVNDELAAITLPSLEKQEAKLEEKVVEQLVKSKPEPAPATEEVKQQVEAQNKLAEPEPPAPPQKSEPPVPQPEVLAMDNAFSTFSLNVSDVSFKLAGVSLEKGTLPDPASVRSEEFINALDYRDPEPAAGAPLAFASERARYPFAHNRDLLRISVKTAAAGRQPGRPLNLVLLLDNSGSMERADRVRILKESLTVLSKQLQPQDKLSIITFSRTPRLWADGVTGDKAAEFTNRVGEITPQGGTDLGAAMDLGYQTALKHYQVGSVNRVVLLTDGAANLGNVNPETLKQKVESHRKQGVAFDCFGVGWEGYNDDLLEQLSRNGDGRYGFINTPEAAATEFAGQLAGALRVAASDVKVQVEFNPKRVTSYRQLGYAKHQLKKEQFRDNTVDAAEIGAAESGNALYTVEVNPRGQGDIATVRVRFKVPGTNDYREHEWAVPFNAPAPALEQSGTSLRLAATSAAFSEWLAQSPFAGDVTTDRLLGMVNGIPAIYGADPRPSRLEWMIRQAKSISGR